MKAQWIWLSEECEHKQDVYAEFKSSFDFDTDSGKKTYLKVSCDSHFVAYINGKLVGFSGCADYPHHKLYDEIDITEFCDKHNEIYIFVWYFGADSQTYITSAPGLWFEASSGDEVVCASGTDTLGRLNNSYKHGYCKVITFQLGFSYYFDNTVTNTQEFLPCRKKKKPYNKQQKLISRKV